MAKIIDGRAARDALLAEAARDAAELKRRGVIPALAVIIVGNDPASRIYVNNKKAACEKTGIKSLEFALPEGTSEEELSALVDRLNADPAVNGILCQLPLPKSVDEKLIAERIAPQKDADCFHPENIGRLWTGRARLAPCTPMGMIVMLDNEGVDLRGKRCVIVGRSDIVGKPMAALALARDATVTVCHSKTENLSEITGSADVLISAVGKAGFIKADMVKKGAAVLDAGINKDKNGRLCGDVDFEAVKEKASLITPVPGGVGPMTIAILMKNSITAAKLQNGIDR